MTTGKTSSWMKQKLKTTLLLLHLQINSLWMISNPLFHFVTLSIKRFVQKALTITQIHMIFQTWVLMIWDLFMLTGKRRLKQPKLNKFKHQPKKVLSSPETTLNCREKTLLLQPLILNWLALISNLLSNLLKTLKDRPLWFDI